MSRTMTRATLASGKVTLSVIPRRRILMRKIQALAGRRKKSVSEQVWELCERALENQEGLRTRGRKIPLPGADLGRVLIKDRKELYDDILAHRL
ncbi:MAG: hypothetical protein HY695_07485 [Deltaproteobacteria bacterium]|nr:hypothetical protein [Deltaproteobacteria bacterium]